VANNIKPNIDNIKIWGLITYYKIKGPKRSKLEPQAEKGILVGYGEDNNNYKVFDLKLRRIIWLRDVKILEGQFLKEKQIKHVSFQEEVEEIEAEGFDITDTPYNNNSNNSNKNNLNNQNNNNLNNNNSNNSNNNNNSNTRIITRSQTRRINSS